MGVTSLSPGKDREFGNTENWTPKPPPGWKNLLVHLVQTPVEYRQKMQCCGAGGGVRGYDIVHALDIANEKLINLKAVAVDALTDTLPILSTSV